eukprot:6201825-Pleurochrysis_carterae.AAC.1
MREVRLRARGLWTLDAARAPSSNAASASILHAACRALGLGCFYSRKMHCNQLSMSIEHHSIIHALRLTIALSIARP